LKVNIKCPCQIPRYAYSLRMRCAVKKTTAGASANEHDKLYSPGMVVIYNDVRPVGDELVRCRITDRHCRDVTTNEYRLYHGV